MMCPVPWLWWCLHWLQVQSISEHFLSVMEIEEKKSRNGLQGPSLHMFHYCHQNRFQSVVQIFNWVGVPSFVSSGFTKQHGVSWLGGRERERDWAMAQTFRKTFRTLQTIQATHATVPVAVKVFFVEILINSRASLVATWRCCNGKVLGTGSRLIRERIVQIAQSLWTFPTVSAHYRAPQRRKCLKTPDERCPCQARRLGSEGWG